MSNSNSLILIVEDEPGIAELLRYTLTEAGFSVEIAACGLLARTLLRNALPQMVLLDWMLPDLSGIELLREWRNDYRTATLPIIMLTAKGMEEDKVRGLNAGADDYVTKPFSPRELVARINAVLRRRSSPTIAGELRVGPIMLDERQHLVLVHGLKVELGPAEFKLLCFLMSHTERTFSRTQLLDQVWGDRTIFEERTVDVHIMRLRRRLGTAADCIKTTRGVGYAMTDLPE